MNALVGNTQFEPGPSPQRPTQLPWAVSAFVLAVLFGSLLINLMMVLTVYFRAPVTDFFWVETDDKASRCPAAQLTVPSVSQARIVDFAGSAAVALNSYDYFNYAALLNSAMRQYMTPNGRVTYTGALEESGILGQIRREFGEVTSVTRQRPNIAQEGKSNGRDYWIVEVPLHLFYKSNVDTANEDRLIIMTVVRVQPSPENPNGIAIDGIRSVFGGGNERF